MRKYLLVVLIFAGAAVTNAQEESFKPGARKFSVEVGFSPLGMGRASQSSIYLPMGELTGFYAISNKFSVRLGLGASFIAYGYDDGEENKWWGWNESINSQTVISFAPGFVYSLKGTKRLTPYVGGEYRFITTCSAKIDKNKDDKRKVINGDEVRNPYDNNSFTRPFNGYGANLFTGFNYYFSKNIYVGAEVGLGFMYAQSKKRIVKQTDEDDIESKDKYSSAGFALYANPQLRLGWAF